jgi:hypothetical protein
MGEIQKVPMAVIQRTRVGYSYQDKYALWRILKTLLSGELVDAFVDRPFGGEGYSIDLIMELRSHTEVYEVKTGDQFVRDRADAVGKVLRTNIYFDKEYRVSRPSTKIASNLVIARVQPEILRHWDKLLWIRQNADNRRKNQENQTATEASAECYRLFKIGATGVSSSQAAPISCEFSSCPNA